MRMGEIDSAVVISFGVKVVGLKSYVRVNGGDMEAGMIQ